MENTERPTWEVSITNEAADWYLDLPYEQRFAIDERVEYLEQHGPAAKRPYVGAVKGSAMLPNLKELIVDMKDRGHVVAIRVLFVFDDEREAILLVGGDKAEAAAFKGWYPQAIATAEARWTRYLADKAEERERREREGW